MGGVGKVKGRMNTVPICKRKLTTNNSAFDKKTAWLKIVSRLKGDKT